MIIVNYIYEFETILSYKRMGDEEREIVLPRENEFVGVDGMTYRVETVIHMLSNNAYDSTQEINIQLTRQLKKT